MAQIVSVYSYRGGTGKTNIISNLGAIVASYGNRVCIVDTDVQSPGVHVVFKLNVKSMTCFLNDYLRGRSSINDAVYDITPILDSNRTDRSKLYVVPASTHIGSMVQILREGYDINLLHDGLHHLGEALNLDYLFIDTHSGINEETLLSIDLSDQVFLVVCPDEQDWDGTAVAVTIARQLKIANLSLIVNKISSLIDVNQLKSNIEAAHVVNVAGMLPHFEEMLHLSNRKRLTFYQTNHPFSCAIETIALRIMQ